MKQYRQQLLTAYGQLMAIVNHGDIKTEDGRLAILDTFNILQGTIASAQILASGIELKAE